MTAAEQAAEPNADAKACSAAPDGAAKPSAPSAASDRWLRWLTDERVHTWIAVAGWVAVVAFVVYTVGSSLIGNTVFLAVDMAESRTPWVNDSTILATPLNQFLGDTVDSMAPRTWLTVTEWRGGSFAEWNPYQVGGVELAGLPNNAIVSPLSWPWWLLPATYAAGVVKVLETAVIGLGMSLFLRRHSVTRAAWPLATLAFVSSGFMIVWTNWAQTRVAAFIPLLFWALDRAAVKPRPRELAITALPVAAMFLGGFPAVTAYALYAGGAYVVVRATVAHRNVWGVVKAGAAAAGGVVTGVLLAAWQMFPFAYNAANSINFDVRAQTPANHLPFGWLGTTFVPGAKGTVPGHGWWGRGHPVEAFVFVGGTVIILAVAALLLRRGRERRTGAVTTLALMTAATVLVAFFGGPALALLQQLPIFGTSHIGRTRVMLGFFIAVLAAFGFDALLRSDGREAELTRLREPGVTRARAEAAARVAGVVVALAVLAHLLFVTFDTTPGRGDFVGQVRVVFTTMLAAALATAVIWAMRAPLARLVAGVAVVGLVAVPAAQVAGQWWPQVNPEMFYQRTPVHYFLDENLDGQRFAPIDGATFPGTNTLYRHRSFTGRSFTERHWRDLILAADHQAFSTPTWSTLRSENIATSATSGVMDRMAVRYIIASPSLPAIGVLDPEFEPTGSTSLAAGGTVTSAEFTGPLRGLRVHIEGVTPGGDGGYLITVLRSLDGSELARTEMWRSTGSGIGWISIAGDSIGDYTPWTAEFSFEPRGLIGDVAVELVLTDDDGNAAVGVVRPTDDGLMVAYTGDATVYERLHALPRVRWASSEAVNEFPALRVYRMNNGSISPDAVVLHSADDARGLPGTSTARVAELPSGTDNVAVQVDADGDGWLIVADSLRRPGWTATVSGEPAEIVEAEHAAGAIFIPTGSHLVVLDFRTPWLRTGLVVSAVTAVAMMAAGVLALRNDGHLKFWPPKQAPSETAAVADSEAEASN